MLTLNSSSDMLVPIISGKISESIHLYTKRNAE